MTFTRFYLSVELVLLLIILTPCQFLSQYIFDVYSNILSTTYSVGSYIFLFVTLWRTLLDIHAYATHLYFCNDSECAWNFFDSCKLIRSIIIPPVQTDKWIPPTHKNMNRRLSNVMPDIPKIRCKNNHQQPRYRSSGVEPRLTPFHLRCPFLTSLEKGRLQFRSYVEQYT